MRRRTDIAWQEVEGRIVGLDLTTSRYFSLNVTGTMLWHRLAEDVDEAGLAQVLVEAHGIEPGVARRDVHAFVAALRSQGLLEQ